eukprot:scaffold33704_cov27-Tisochrysis_lutea.AAC.2
MHLERDEHGDGLTHMRNAPRRITKLCVVPSHCRTSYSGFRAPCSSSGVVDKTRWRDEVPSATVGYSSSTSEMSDALCARTAASMSARPSRATLSSSCNVASWAWCLRSCWISTPRRLAAAVSISRSACRMSLARPVRKAWCAESSCWRNASASSAIAACRRTCEVSVSSICFDARSSSASSTGISRLKLRSATAFDVAARFTTRRRSVSARFIAAILCSLE